MACYDGPDSSGAVQLGALLAAAVQQPLILACAYAYDPVALSAQVTSAQGNDARFDAAQHRVERAERLVPDSVKVRSVVVPAEGVPQALADFAREVDACVLVVGRDLGGHVTRLVLQRALCPVAVSPLSVPLPGEGRIETIGVAYDASPGARFALSAAMHLASLTGARVKVIAIGTQVNAGVAADPVPEPIEIDTCLMSGDPGACLIEATNELDLLLCGSHGRGRALSAILGSVSARLLEAAHCPVVVIPPKIRHRVAAPLGLSTAAG